MAYSQSIREANAARDPRYAIRFSAGLAVYEPSSTPDLETLMRRADEAMYERKRRQAPARPSASPGSPGRR